MSGAMSEFCNHKVFLTAIAEAIILKSVQCIKYRLGAEGDVLPMMQPSRKALNSFCDSSRSLSVNLDIAKYNFVNRDGNGICWFAMRIWRENVEYIFLPNNLALFHWGLI